MNITLISRNEEIVCACESIISKTLGESAEVQKNVVSAKGKVRLKEEVCSDFYLIDADTPRLDLEAVAGSIQAMPGMPLIILLANSLEYAVQGFEWGTFRYVLKEQLEEKLGQAVLAGADVLRERDTAAYCIKTHSRYLNIYYKDIKYIFKQGKNCIFVTEKGQYRIRKSMEGLVKEMNRPEFIRISRGVSVNVNEIESWRGVHVILHDGTNLAATRMQPDILECL